MLTEYYRLRYESRKRGFGNIPNELSDILEFNPSHFKLPSPKRQHIVDSTSPLLSTTSSQEGITYTIPPLIIDQTLTETTNQTSINIFKQASHTNQDIINNKQLFTITPSSHPEQLPTTTVYLQKQQSPILSQKEQITTQLNDSSLSLNRPKETYNQQLSVSILSSTSEKEESDSGHIDKNDDDGNEDNDDDDHSNKKNNFGSDFDFQYTKPVPSPPIIQHDNDSSLKNSKSPTNNNQLLSTEDDHHPSSVTKIVSSTSLPTSLLSKNKNNKVEEDKEKEKEVGIVQKNNQEISRNDDTVVDEHDQFNKQHLLDDSINILPKLKSQDNEKNNHEKKKNQDKNKVELEEEKEKEKELIGSNNDNNNNNNRSEISSNKSQTDISDLNKDQDILSQNTTDDQLEKQPHVEIEVETSELATPSEMMDYKETNEDVPLPPPSQVIEEEKYHTDDHRDSSLSIKSSSLSPLKHTNEYVHSNQSSPIIQPLKDLKITDNDHPLSINESSVIDNKKGKSTSSSHNTEILLDKMNDGNNYVQKENKENDDLIINDIIVPKNIDHKHDEMPSPLQLDDNDITIVNGNNLHQSINENLEDQKEKKINDRNKQIEEKDIHFDFDHDNVIDNNEDDFMEEQGNENGEENEFIEENETEEEDDDDNIDIDDEIDQYFQENMNMEQMEEKRNLLRKEIKPDLLKFFENEQLPDNVEDIDMDALVRFLERNMSGMIDSTAKSNLAKEIFSAESAIIKVTASFKNELPSIESRRLVDMFGLKLTHQLRTQFELYTELKQLELLYNRLKRQHNTSRTKAQSIKIEHDNYTKKLKIRKAGLVKLQKAKKSLNEYETFFQDIQDALLEQ